MKTEKSKLIRFLAFAGVLFFCCAAWVKAQTRFQAHTGGAGAAGNQPAVGTTLGSDFYVLKPITIWDLGIFDDRTNGIQGSTVLTVQLFVHNVNFTNLDDSGTLLETVTFDAANPGALVGGNRFKALPVPVTLLPGSYTITASGFDTNNPAGNASLAPYAGNPSLWTANDGAGLIRFEQARHGESGFNQFPTTLDAFPASAYAAGTFSYSEGSLPSPADAADYAALTQGVKEFRLGSRRRTGSIAVFNANSFPVLVEPTGNRLVIEAAGVYNDDPNGGRCVVFGHPQWGHGHRTQHAQLFNNAIRWASRKTNPADIVVGLGPLLEPDYYTSLGYQVRTFPAQLAGDTNGLPQCDVLVLDWHAGFDEAAVAQMAEFTAHGGNLVVTVSPWELVHGGIQPAFGQVNGLLQPFGLAYRPSTTVLQDMTVTNVQAQAYPPYFRAFPAAELLGRDRLGQLRLSTLEKLIALNTINYALNARPDLMDQLTSISSGGSHDNSLPPVSAGSFTDVLTLKGAQAIRRLGPWTDAGDDLIASDGRGAVEYEFNLAAGDLYKLQIIGTQDIATSPARDFDLVLSLDDVSLGHQRLAATFGVDGLMECFTPYLAAGTHTLRISWENAASFTALRLKAIHVQAGQGADSDGDGIKDWVEQLVRSQSGLDLTESAMSSFVSPVCLEGRDLFLGLSQISVQGSQNGAPQMKPAPNGRWYANVDLPPDQNTPLVLNVSYQNGALSQWRQLQWKSINLLTTTNLHWTVRAGDSLLLTARPLDGTNAAVVITGGSAGPRNTTANNPIPIKFETAGTYTIAGNYSAIGHEQSRSITVDVVGFQFSSDPDAWAFHSRDWDLANIPAGAVLESDRRMIFEHLAILPNQGERIGLIADNNEPRSVLARMGEGGPVLDSARINAFRFSHGSETYVNVLETYDDGSQLVEMLLVLSPAPADLKIQLDVIVGGVVFEDGTVSRTLTASDFDTRGRSLVRFIRPDGVRTAVCHSIRLTQGSATVGWLR